MVLHATVRHCSAILVRDKLDHWNGHLDGPHPRYELNKLADYIVDICAATALRLFHVGGAFSKLVDEREFLATGSTHDFKHYNNGDLWLIIILSDHTNIYVFSCFNL